MGADQRPLQASVSQRDAKALATLAYLHNGKLDYPRRVLGATVTPPWEMYETESHDRYYHNTITDEATWDPPIDALPSGGSVPSTPGPSGRYMGSVSIIFASVEVSIVVDPAGRSFYLATSGFHTVKRCGPVPYTLSIDPTGDKSSKYRGTLDGTRSPRVPCIVKLLNIVGGVIPDVEWDEIADTVTIYIKNVPLLSTYTLTLSKAKTDLPWGALPGEL